MVSRKNGKSRYHDDRGANLANWEVSLGTLVGLRR